MTSSAHSQLHFRSLAEREPGAAWATVFADGWPGWRRWYLQRIGPNGPSLDESATSLRRYMPELERLWERLIAVVGADEDAARFLTFWEPPRYLVNCSQAVKVDRDGPLLVRNYDLDPALSEGTLLHSAWLGRPVVGMTEGLLGLSDGMNRMGLTASITFGGRPVRGRGFGIPIIIRYLVELCADVSDALEALRRIPCHMSYNVTVTDRRGECATVFLAPDRPAIVRPTPYVTNHQLGLEWPQHARFSRTRERYDFLGDLLPQPWCDGAALVNAFLHKPIYMPHFDRGFGTVYTAAYRPCSGHVSLYWPDHPPWHRHIDDNSLAGVSVSYLCQEREYANWPEPGGLYASDPAHVATPMLAGAPGTGRYPGA